MKDKPSLHDDPKGGTKLVSLVVVWFIALAICTGLIIGKIIVELITR